MAWSDNARRAAAEARKRNYTRVPTKGTIRVRRSVMAHWIRMSRKEVGRRSAGVSRSTVNRAAVDRATSMGEYVMPKSKRTAYYTVKGR